MVLWVLLGFWVVVGGSAAYVALFVPDDEPRATRAFEVLKLVVRYGLGASALVAVATALEKTGVDLPALLTP